MATRYSISNHLPTDRPLLILHPGYTNQHVLLASALRQSDRVPVFVSFDQAATSLQTAWNLLSTALNEQTGHPLPAFEARFTPEKAAQSALKVLKTVGKLVLVFDAVDRVDSPVENWIGAIARGLPANSQIVIGGRRLPLSLARDTSLHDLMRLYPVDPDRMLLDDLNQPADRVLLEVYGLGPGQALINGQPIDRWDGTLPRSLFYYFIDRGMVTRDEIFQTFWPNLSVREATNVFHVTKRKISEILGFDLTVYWSGFYRLSPEVDLHYDVVKFAEHVQNSVVADDDTASQLLQQAIDLYQGVFLGTLDMDWAKTRREELGLTYTEALSSLARLRQGQNKPEEALGLYLRAAANQPHREDLARGIMSLFADLGQCERAMEVYERLTNELKRSLNVTPDRRTVEMAERIRNCL